MSAGARQLLLTLSNIGDAVMTTPVLCAMHELNPDALVDIVADMRSAEIFEHCPFRGDIFLKEKKKGWRGLFSLINRLRQRRYSLVVDLRTDGLSYLLRADRRYTKRRIEHNGLHAVERSYAVIAPALRSASKPETALWLTDAHRHFAAAKTSSLPSGRWLAIGPGANWPPKIWPTGHFRDLLALLANECTGVILLGGGGDVEICSQLASSITVPTINLAGATGLLEAAAVMEKAGLFVGNDSGLGHIAAAVGTPTLTLFGPGDAERYHPWGVNARWLVAPDRNLEMLSPRIVADQIRAMLTSTRVSSVGDAADREKT